MKIIIRIISFLLVVSLIGTALWGCEFHSPFDSYDYMTGEVYQNSGSYLTGSFTYTAEEIKSVEIHWRSGEVNLTESDSEELSVTESDAELPEESAMHYLIDNGVLKIYFCASGAAIRVYPESKHLSVEIPKNIDVQVKTTSAPVKAGDLEQKNVEIDTESGNAELGGVKAESVDIGTTSGTIIADEIHADSLECGTVSGAVSIGTVLTRTTDIGTTSGCVTVDEAISTDEIEIGTVSGAIKLGSAESKNIKFSSTSGAVRASSIRSNAMRCGTVSGSVNIENIYSDKIDISATSGSVTLGLTGTEEAEIGTTSGEVSISLLGCGAEITYSSTSGKLSTGLDFTQNGNTYLFGDGKCKIEVGTTSGKLEIQ